MMIILILVEACYKWFTCRQSSVQYIYTALQYILFQTEFLLSVLEKVNMIDIKTIYCDLINGKHM